MGGRGITHEEERFLQSGEGTLGTWQSRFPSAVGTALHQHTVKLRTCRTVQGDMWDRTPGSALGPGGLWSRLADRFCNFGKGEGEAKLACVPHAGPLCAASPGCVPVAVPPQQREEPGSGVPDSVGPSRSPRGSVSPCHAVGDVCECGGSTALPANPTLPAPWERGHGDRRGASACGTARALPA